MQNQSSFFSGAHMSLNKSISFVTLMKWMGLYFLAYAALLEAASKTVDVAVWGDQYDLSRNATGWGGFAGLKALFNQQDPGTIRLCTGDIL